MESRSPQRPSILAYIDTYLEYHGPRDPRVVEYVVAVLTKYDHMVSLAAERAIVELYVPDNVYQMFPRGGAIQHNEPA